MWSAADLEGEEQTTPADADSNGCGWNVSVTVPIDENWRSGFYLVTLRAHDEPPDRAVGIRGVRGPRRLATRAGAAGDRNEHVQRLQQLGWQEPVHRRVARVVRPAVRSRHADATLDRTRRSQGPAEIPRRGARRRRGDLSGVPLRQRIPGLHELGRMVHLRTPIRGVGRGRWHRVRLRGVERPRSRPRHRRRIRRRCWAWVTTSTGRPVNAPRWSGTSRLAATTSRMSGNTMFWQVRLEDDGRAMVCYKYKAHEVDPVVGTEGQVDDVGDVGRSVGRPARRQQSSAQGRRTGCTAASAPRCRGAREHSPSTATSIGCSRAPACATATCWAPTMAWSDTRPSAAGWDSTHTNCPSQSAATDRPADVEIVAFTPSSNLAMGEYPASIAALDDQGDLEFIASRLHGRVDDESLARCRYGNAMMLTCRPFGDDGGEVVTVGSTDWVYGLADPLVGAA